MKYSSAHLCLVTSHPVPNLVPACDPAHKPERVVLVTCEQTRQYARWLKQVFAGRGISSEIWPVDDPYDYAHTRQTLEKLLQRSDMAEIALNATGGTRVMALAACELFRQRNLPIFYVQPHKDYLLPLNPPGPGMPIADELRLEEYLQAHGYIIQSLRRNSIDAKRHRLGRQLLEHLDVFDKALGVVNYLASTAVNRNPLESDPVAGRHWGTRGFDRLIALLKEEGLVDEINGRLRFASEESRFFVNGGWLEEFLFAQVDRLRNRLKIQDAAMSVMIESPSGSENEIDLAILYNNRLHIVECKTRQFEGGAGSRVLYKMDTLRDLCGITSRAMLASFNKLPLYDSRRARDLGIKLVMGSELRGAGELIEMWLKENLYTSL